MALFKVFRGQRNDLDSVAKVDGHAYFCTDDGSFWIDYKDLDEVKRKQINKDDWNEDIQAAVAALKSEIEEELVNKTDYLGAVSSLEELSTIAGNGDYYRVSQEFQFGDEIAHVGDLLIALINLPAQTPECWDLIHTGVTVQVDYEQNDENAQDYIKNRPFYDSSVVIPSKTYTFDGIVEGKEYVELERGGYLVKISDDTPSKEQLINSTVIIAMNNNEEESIAISEKSITENPLGKGTLALGEFIIIVSEVGASIFNTGIGIYFVSLSDEEYISKLITSEIATSELKQLDEKFVPDTIARVEDIPKVDQTYISDSENAQSGKAIAKALEPIIIQNSEQDNKIAELEGRVTIATFDITEANTTITLKNLVGMTEIDWGDGVINSKLSHTYAEIEEYVCKIYDVVTIGLDAFSDCDSLTNVVIGDSVISIGERAFADCSSLTSVIFKNPNIIGYDPTWFSSNLKYIYVPTESFDAYKKAWSSISGKIDSIAHISNILKAVAIENNKIPYWDDSAKQYKTSAFTANANNVSISATNGSKVSLNAYGVNVANSNVTTSLLPNVIKNGEATLQLPHQDGVFALLDNLGGIVYTYTLEQLHTIPHSSFVFITSNSGNDNALSFNNNVLDTAGNAVPASKWYLIIAPINPNGDGVYTGFVVYPTKKLGVTSISSKQINYTEEIQIKHAKHELSSGMAIWTLVTCFI